MFGAAGCPSKKLAFSGSLAATAKCLSHSGQRELRGSLLGVGEGAFWQSYCFPVKGAHPSHPSPSWNVDTYLEEWQPSCDCEAESHMLRMAAQGVRSPLSQSTACPSLPTLSFLPMCKKEYVALFKLLPTGFLLLVAERNVD